MTNTPAESKVRRGWKMVPLGGIELPTPGAGFLAFRELDERLLDIVHVAGDRMLRLIALMDSDHRDIAG